MNLVLEGTGTGLWEWRVGEDRVRWSATVGPMFGLAPGEAPPSYEAYLELVHPDDRERLHADVQRALETGEGYTREFRVLRADGRVRWLSSRAHVLMEEGRPASILGVIGDTTERKQQAVASEYLARASAVLAESLAVEPALERIAALAVPELADWCTVNLAAGDGIQQIAVAHQDPERVELAREYSRRHPPDPAARTGVGAVLRTGRTEHLAEITPEMIAAAGLAPDQERVIRELGLRSVLTVPMPARGSVLGAISFVMAESGRQFGTADIELAEELGRRAGLTVDNVRLYEQAQHTAETLQRSLLPDRLPDLRRLDVAARYLPGMAGTEVGGDWYDVIDLPSGATAIVVGDVMGRGIRAAALMGQLRTAVRTYALIAADPAETMGLVADYVSARGDVDFATVLLLAVDAPARTVRACSAGHLPPVLRSGGDARLVDMIQGPPLGVADQRYACTDFALAAGDSLLLYTDGLVERRGTQIDTGLARLLEGAAEGPSEPGALVDHLISALLGAGTEDDVAVLAVRAHPDP